LLPRLSDIGPMVDFPGDSEGGVGWTLLVAPSKPALLKTLVFRPRVLVGSSPYSVVLFRRQQQNPTIMAASSTTAAITTATAIAIILPDDIFAFGKTWSDVLVPEGGINVTVRVTTELPIVCKDCVVIGVVILVEDGALVDDDPYLVMR
jgi:hypothetical protein